MRARERSRVGIPWGPKRARGDLVWASSHCAWAQDDLVSTFYNDIYVFRMDQRRWFPLTLRGPGKKPAGPGRRRQKSSSCASSSFGDSVAPEVRCLRPRCRAGCVQGASWFMLQCQLFPMGH